MYVPLKNFDTYHIKEQGPNLLAVCLRKIYGLKLSLINHQIQNLTIQPASPPGKNFSELSLDFTELSRQT